MKVTESGCVDCGFPCMGSSCPNYTNTFFRCDKCGSDNAEYKIDGEDFCESCAEEIIDEAFGNFDLEERAKLVEVDLEKITDNDYLDDW